MFFYKMQREKFENVPGRGEKGLGIFFLNVS